MASGLWSEGQIWCPTCLNILTDPVTLPCGHSYCMGCIRTQWDRVDHIGVYSCPQCGETFAQRPDVHRNTELADVVEQLRSSSFHDPPPAPSPAGPGDVLCDVCTGRPARAVKSCLVCLASYCQTHLQPHRQSPALSAHPLVDATGRPGGTARADPQGPWDPLWQMGGDGRSSAVANLVRMTIYVRPGAPGDSPSIPVRPHFSPEAVRRAVSGLKERLENFCREELVKISRTGGFLNTILSSSLQSDACQLTLDPNTAHRHLRLSEGNRRVTWSREPQQYPDHPERFDHWQQVLCREGLSGTRCYWEVEWSGIGGFIGVAYKGITRKGEAKDGVFGGNDQSWSLVSSGLSCSFWHSRKGATITGPLAPRIGVYVDHRAGTLSFYSVSGDTATLLHRVQASFTEPLYPGFGIGLNTTVGLCRLDRPLWS
nr:PREDICTED: E3 ubiquitin/ISG15 ligase TRIM25-like [Lepisosteus oculatus]